MIFIVCSTCQEARQVKLPSLHRLMAVLSPPIYVYPYQTLKLWRPLGYLGWLFYYRCSPQWILEKVLCLCFEKVSTLLNTQMTIYRYLASLSLALEFAFRIVLIFSTNPGKCGGIWFNSLPSRLRKLWQNVALTTSRMSSSHMSDVRMLASFTDVLDFSRMSLAFLTVCSFCLCSSTFVCRSVNIFAEVMAVLRTFVRRVSFSLFLAEKSLTFRIVLIRGHGVSLVSKLNNKSLFISSTKYMYF